MYTQEEMQKAIDAYVASTRDYIKYSGEWEALVLSEIHAGKTEHVAWWAAADIERGRELLGLIRVFDMDRHRWKMQFCMMDMTTSARLAVSMMQFCMMDTANRAEVV